MKCNRTLTKFVLLISLVMVMSMLMCNLVNSAYYDHKKNKNTSFKKIHIKQNKIKDNLIKIENKIKSEKLKYNDK